MVTKCPAKQSHTLAILYRLPFLGENHNIHDSQSKYSFECGKMRTRKTPNTDTFCPVRIITSLSLALSKHKIYAT